jgi:hypothetical protein
MFAVLAAALSLAACGNDKQVVWRQKMIVAVETPEGVKSGASVIEVNVQIGQNPMFKNTEGSAVRWDITGEAVTVDLGGGKYLFALLTAPNYFGQPGRNAGYVFSDTAKKMVAQWVDEIADLPKGEAKALTADSYPLLVTFADINDPKSVAKLDPANLAAAFGPGHALKAITLEITKEKVSDGGVEQVLGWLCGLHKSRARLNGSTSVGIFDNELSNNLDTGDFQVGECS